MQFDAETTADGGGRPPHEHRGKQGRRLQRHADALADQRMTFSGGVADAKHAAAYADPNSGTERTHGQPSALAGGAFQRLMDPGA